MYDLSGPQNTPPPEGVLWSGTSFFPQNLEVLSDTSRHDWKAFLVASGGRTKTQTCRFNYLQILAPTGVLRTEPPMVR